MRKKENDYAKTVTLYMEKDVKEGCDQVKAKNPKYAIGTYTEMYNDLLRKAIKNELLSSQNG